MIINYSTDGLGGLDQGAVIVIVPRLLNVVVVGCFDGPPDAWRDRQTFFAGEQITGCL